MSLFTAKNSLQRLFTFDIQRFATGTLVKIVGNVNNVEIGDTFTVGGANYKVLSVETDSVTAIVDGTPSANLGKKIVIGDGKSIDGITYQTTDTSNVDGTIKTKYTYKLDIDGNSIFVTVFDGAIATVTDSGDNVLTATGNTYTIGSQNFALTLDDGIPTATYTDTNSVAATLDTITYSFGVDNTPVSVVVKDGNISTVSVNSSQVGTAAGIYTVGNRTLEISYANDILTAQTASTISVNTVTPAENYEIDNTIVTVNSSGELSTSTATIDGNTATLTYDSTAKKITANYTVTETLTAQREIDDPNNYSVTLPDSSTVTVAVNNGQVNAVTQGGTTLSATDGVYLVGDRKLTIDTETEANRYVITLPDNSKVAVKYDTETGDTTVTRSDKSLSNSGGAFFLGENTTLNLTFDDNHKLTTATLNETVKTNAPQSVEQIYTVTVGSESVTVKVKYDGKLYLVNADNIETALTANSNDIYIFTVGGGDNAKEVRLKCDNDKLVEPIFDLSKLTEDYTAKDGEILTGTVNGHNIFIDDGATVILRDVNITGGTSAAGISCNGNATLILEGTNTVTGTDNAGIKAGDTGTTLTITGTGSLIAKSNSGMAGIGANHGGTCGNIIINGGTVAATGGDNAAGIGSGFGYGNNSTCGNITINGGNIIATGGKYGAGIGSGFGYNSGTGECGNITINGGNIIATGGKYGAGIGSGYSYGSGTGKCGDITINGGTVSATGGDNAADIGSGYNSTCGTVTINGQEYPDGYNDDEITGTSEDGESNSVNTAAVEISEATFTQTETLNGKTVIVYFGTSESFTATIDGQAATISGDKITVDGKIFSVTVANNAITGIEQVTELVTAAATKIEVSSAQEFNPKFALKSTTYTFAVNGSDVSVTVDSSGTMTYGGQTVTGKKITVGGVEVTLNVENNAITGATYLGEYSAVTEITQIDAYNVTIGGQVVSCSFDANGQCTVTVNGKNYSVTKTTNGATVASDETSVGTEDARSYLLEVDGEKHLINCTFDAAGNLTSVTSDDSALSIDGMTVKFGDYTVTVDGTSANLTAVATKTVVGEGVNDIEINQLFTLSGVKSVDGVTVANGIVTLSAANLNGANVTITGDGYTLALDKNYLPTTTAEHFDGNSYKSAGTSDGYELSDDGKSIRYVSAVGEKTLFTLSGLKSTDGITVANGIVTLSAANLNGQDISITGDGYRLALDKNYLPTTTAERFDGNSYKSASTSDGYELSDDGKSIRYVSAVGSKTLFTLSGVKSTGGVTVANGIVTLSAANLNGQDVSITGDGYTLALDKNYLPTTTAERFDGNSYKSASSSDGYEISDDGKSIRYVSAVGSKTLFTLSGVKSTDGVTVANGIVTLSAANLNGQDVSITGDGYTLALDKNYLLTATGAHFDGNSYKSASSSDGYEISDDGKSIRYVSAVGSKTLFTLSGVKSTGGVTVANGIITLSASNLNGQDISITGDGYTLALDKNYSPTTTAEHFDGNSYKSASTSDGYELSDDGKSIRYVSAVGSKTLFTLSGVKSTGGVTVANGIVTLSASNLNGANVTITGDGYRLALDKNYLPTTTGAHFDGNSYKSASTSDGYELSDDGKSIRYVSAVGSKTSFTLSGVKSTDGVTVANGIVTLSASNLNGQDVSITGDGYTFALDKNYLPTTTGAHFDGNSYKSASSSDGYELSDDGKSIRYVSAVGSKTLFTLSGVKSTDGVTVANGIITLSAANLNGENVTITGDGYTLALDKNYSPTTTGAHFDGNSYKSASSSDGYEISDDGKSIRYVSAVDEKTLFTLSGVKSTDGVTVANGIVTLSAANLNGENVTITGDGYTLALDKNYLPTTTAEHFDGNSYKSASTSDGYELSDDGKSIRYVSAVGEKTLFTLSGVKSVDGVTVANGIITLSASNLNGENVTITGDGYRLALDKNYLPTTTAEHFDGNSYKSASSSDGYELSDDGKSIRYVSAVGSKTLFTLSGVKSTDGVTVANGIVTLSAANLNGENVTITGDGYTLKPDDTIKTPIFDAGGRRLSGNVAIYKSASNTAGYTLSNDGKSIIYTAATDTEILLTVTGVKSLDGLSLSENIMTVSATSLDRQTVTISKGYKLKLADDVEQPALKSKNWTKLDDDTYLYANGGTTAGYTLKGNKIVYSDATNGGEQYTITGAATGKLISEIVDTETVDEDSLNRHKVILIDAEGHGSENRLVFYGENYALVTVGSGQYSLITCDGARSKIDMSDADNVTVASFGGKVTLDNYNVDGGAVVLAQDVDDIVDAVKSDSIKLVGNVIQMNSASHVAINSGNDSTIVNLTTSDGQRQLVGFTGTNGGTLDTSELSGNFLLKGNYAEKSSAQQKQIGSTIVGGSGNDTILAGSRDFVDGGGGRNEIYLTPYEFRDKKDGATVVSAKNSHDTVHGFNAGFCFGSDVIQVENLFKVNFNFTAEGLQVNGDTSKLLLDGIGLNSSSADAESDFVADTPEMLLLTDGQSTLNAVVAQTNQTVLVTTNEHVTPNAFFGNRSGLNFSAYGGNVEVNLAHGTGKIGNRNAIFSGIDKVQAGDTLSTLIGSQGFDTLIAGNGHTKLTGGAGTDKLFGRSGSADKNGRSTFFYFAGDGRDFVYDFEFLTTENKFAGIADELAFAEVVESIFCDGTGVVLQLNDEDSLILTGAVGKDFRINGLVAQVAENITFDGLANYYIADGGTSVNVDSGVENAEIWLDNSHGTIFAGNLRTLDASSVAGKTSLVGNDNDNTIIAGHGDSSLWGGEFSSNDLLIGGASRNDFFYCLGDGSDTIQGANDGDSVILSDITLDQIISADVSGDAVTINFIDGGSLKIDGSPDLTYQLADGSKYFISRK